MGDDAFTPNYRLPSQLALRHFVQESNLIEGILRPPTEDELRAHWRILDLSEVRVEDLEEFVGVVQPDARLRVQLGLDVMVADHVAMPGGYAVRAELMELLRDAFRTRRSAYSVGCAYQHLHPFTDGNGRSGRALWLWQMTRCTQRHPRGQFREGVSFLHEWYYQSLAHHDAQVREARHAPATV